jgi:hypothetical protein
VGRPGAASGPARRRRRRLAHRRHADAEERAEHHRPRAHPFDFGSYYKPDGSPNDGAGPAQQRLREQDEDGIDAEVLFPPVFASRFLEGIKDPDVYRAMIRAYNTWLANDYCAVAPDRLIGNSVTPISDIDHAVAEVEFAHSAGLKSVAFYQFPNGTGYSQPEDDKFWAKCIELGMAISPHFGFGQIRPEPRTAGSGTAGQPYAEALVQRAGSHAPVFCMAQLMAAVCSIASPTSSSISPRPTPVGCRRRCSSWTTTTRSSRRLRWAPHEDDARASTSPKHFHFSIIRDPLALDYTDKIPVDNLMWGSDFPHSVGSFPHSQDFIKSAFKAKTS